MGRLMGVTVNVVLKSFYYAQNWQNIFVSHNPIKYMHDFFLPRSLDFSQLLHTYIVRSLSFSLLPHNSNKRKNNKYTAQCHSTHTCIGILYSNCIIVIVEQEELGTNRNCNCDMTFTFCAGQNRISSFTTLVSAAYSCYPCHPWVCAVAEGGRRHTTTGDYAFTTLNEGSLEVSVVLRGQTLSLQDHLYL